MKILIIRFSHAIRLVKSGRQFVFKIVYIQDIVYYALSGSCGTINLTRLLYQICRRGKSDENDYFYVQNIKNSVKYLWRRYIFANIAIARNPLTIFAKNSFLNNWLEYKYYPSGISKVTLHKCTRTGTYAKMKGKYCTKDVFLVKACGNWSGQIVRTAILK